MGVFAIADLHLSISVPKPMDVFGGNWEGYQEKLFINWNKVVSDEDLVIVAGDFSWATYLEDALSDFKFLDSLNGRKLLIKGNHDYWWTSVSKMKKFLSDNNIDSVEILNNNSFSGKGFVVCGSRGWNMNDDRILKRELLRLKLSLTEAQKLKEPTDLIISALHFPPYEKNEERSAFEDLMIKFNVNICVYGHVHGISPEEKIDCIRNGIKYRFVAADYLEFTPLKLL